MKAGEAVREGLLEDLLGDEARLDEDLSPHESLEAPPVELGLDRRQLLPVSAHEMHLSKLLALLVAVPELQEVDYRHVVRLHSIHGGEPVPFEPLKFGCVADGAPPPCIYDRQAKLLCVHLDFALDSEQ